MAAETETFLRAEQSVTELLDSLERLKEEVEGYSKAKGTLDEVKIQLVSLIQSLQLSGEQISYVMAALQRIGTPAILSGIEKVVIQNNDTATSVDAIAKSIDSVAPSLDFKIEKWTANNMEAFKGLTAAIRKQADTHAETLSQRIDSTSKNLANEMNQIVQRVEAQGKSLKLMVGIGLPLVAVVIGALVLFVKYY